MTTASDQNLYTQQFLTAQSLFSLKNPSQQPGV